MVKLVQKIDLILLLINYLLVILLNLIAILNHSLVNEIIRLIFLFKIPLTFLKSLRQLIMNSSQSVNSLKGQSVLNDHRLHPFLSNLLHLTEDQFTSHFQISQNYVLIKIGSSSQVNIFSVFQLIQNLLEQTFPLLWIKQVEFDTHCHDLKLDLVRLFEEIGRKVLIDITLRILKVL